MEDLVRVPTIDSNAEIEAYTLDLHQRPIHVFDAIDLGSKVQYEYLQKRVDNVVFVLDPNLSEEKIGDVPTTIYSKDILKRFVSTVPDEMFNLLVFDESEAAAGVRSKHVWTQDKREVLYWLNLNNRDSASSRVSLAERLEDVYEIVHRADSPTAIVVFTEWDHIDNSVVEAVARLQQYSRYSEGVTVSTTTNAWNKAGIDNRTCIHFVGLSGYLSRSRASMQGCSVSVAAPAIFQAADMAAFVEQILFVGPKDSDNDGVFDFVDECPGTPEGRVVNFSGCIKFPNNLE